MKYMVDFASETNCTTEIVEADNIAKAWHVARGLLSSGYGYVIRSRVVDDGRDDDVVVLAVVDVDESYVPTISCEEVNRYLSDSGYVSAEERFEKKVAEYKAMGVRMVCFDTNQSVCEDSMGSWIMAFYTHGKNADDMPIERFVSPAMKEWMRFDGYRSLNELEHYDMTDDAQSMMNYYDYEANFVVQQLV